MLFRTSFIAALLLTLTAPASAAGPGAAIMATVNGVVRSFGVDKPSSVGTWFTPNATVVDDFAPYSWTGTNAAVRWWTALDAGNVKAGLAKLRITARPVTQFDVSGDIAYVVVPLDLSFVLKSKLEHQSGLWALTLRRSGERWTIVSASWALETSTV
jgi:SnoaL-like domain